MKIPKYFYAPLFLDLINNTRENLTIPARMVFFWLIVRCDIRGMCKIDYENVEDELGIKLIKFRYYLYYLEKKSIILKYDTTDKFNNLETEIWIQNFPEENLMDPENLIYNMEERRGGR